MTNTTWPWTDSERHWATTAIMHDDYDYDDCDDVIKREKEKEKETQVKCHGFTATIFRYLCKHEANKMDLKSSFSMEERCRLDLKERHSYHTYQPTDHATQDANDRNIE